MELLQESACGTLSCWKLCPLDEAEKPGILHIWREAKQGSEYVVQQAQKAGATLTTPFGVLQLARGSRSRQVPLLREDVPLDEPGGQERVLCDECGASLPELHRRCDAKSCPIGGSDICLRCLQTHPRWVGQDEVSCKLQWQSNSPWYLAHLLAGACEIKSEAAALGCHHPALP